MLIKYLQYALASNKSSCIKHSIRKSIVRRSRKIIISIYLALVMPHLIYCVQFGALQNTWRIRIKGSFQQRVTMLVRGLDYMTEESLRELILLSMESRKRTGI